MTVRNAFDPTGREQYSAKMRQVGYVEVQFFGASSLNYCCQSCPAMWNDPKSPTGYWCKLVQIPDKPNGCCDKWYPAPEVQRLLDIENQ